jgi:hypothetical protein
MLRYWDRRFLANGETALTLNIISVKTRGRVISQAVSCQIPTTAAGVRAQVRWCGICGGQSSTAVGFLRLLRFAIWNTIPPGPKKCPTYQVDTVSPHPMKSYQNMSWQQQLECDRSQRYSTTGTHCGSLRLTETHDRFSYTSEAEVHSRFIEKIL